MGLSFVGQSGSLRRWILQWSTHNDNTPGGILQAGCNGPNSGLPLLADGRAKSVDSWVEVLKSEPPLLGFDPLQGSRVLVVGRRLLVVLGECVVVGSQDRRGRQVGPGSWHPVWRGKLWGVAKIPRRVYCGECHRLGPHRDGVGPAVEAKTPPLPASQVPRPCHNPTCLASVLKRRSIPREAPYQCLCTTRS